jgi:hypothetical protein
MTFFWGVLEERKREKEELRHGSDLSMAWRREEEEGV